MACKRSTSKLQSAQTILWAMSSVMVAWVQGFAWFGKDGSAKYHI